MPTTKMPKREATRILDRVVEDMDAVATLLRTARANILRELQTDARAAQEVEWMADGLRLWLDDMAEER